MIQWFFDIFRRRPEQQEPITVIELVPAETYFKLYSDYQAAKRELAQFENDFYVRVALELRYKTASLAEENQRLKAELESLQNQLKNYDDCTNGTTAD